MSELLQIYKRIKTTSIQLLAMSCFLVPSILFSQDFKIQHVQDDIGNSGGTNTGFTAVSSLNSAFALPTNNRKTHAGRTDLDAGALEGDDMAGARVLTGTGTLTYYRESGSQTETMRFNTNIWEYNGAPGGTNEFIVRGRYAVDINAANFTNVDLTGAGIVDPNKCIPFITGIMNDDTSNGSDSGTGIAHLDSATNLIVRRGTDNSTNNVRIYITLVEFTGSNWTVLHGYAAGSTAATGSITLYDGYDATGTATDVSAWSDAIIFTHSRAETAASGGNKEFISSQWPIMAPGADTQTVDWTFDSGRPTTDNQNRHFVHVLANTELNVTRITDTNSATNPTVDITSAGLTDISQSSIVGTSITSGTGNGYGRGWRNYYINSANLNQAMHWAHRSGSTMSHNLQIIDFSALTTSQTEAPGGVTSSLQLWLKADEGIENAVGVAAVDGQTVLNWLDNTINTYVTTQGTGSNRPIFNESGINFNPTIDFDGTNHEMISSSDAYDEITIFVVADGTYSSIKSLLNLDNGANGSVNIELTGSNSLTCSYTDSGPSTSGVVSNDLTATVSGIPYLVNYRHLAGAKSRLFINGILQTVPGSNTNGNTLSGTLTVGIGADPSSSSTRWNGGIAELIILNQKVVEADRIKIESYLAIKYGLTLGDNGTSQDYVDTDGRVIWDFTDNTGYNYNVTGIGKDTKSELEQKQSKSINTTDDITVGIKGIAATNDANTAEFFADKTFLMWGHNNLSTSAGTDISKDFGAGTGLTTNLSATPINRIWKMVVTDSIPTVKLSIPETMVSATNAGGEEYVMIVADDAAFTTNVTSATMDDVGSDLEVDFYFEGTKYITFGSAPEVSLGSSSAYFDNYDATDTYLDAGDVNDLDNTDFTMSAWVRRDVGAEKFDVISKRNYFGEYIHPTDSLLDIDGVYTHGYAFRINKKGQFRMVWADPDDVIQNQLQTKETIPANEWHHIAASYDISENMAILYIDGIHVYDSDDYLVDRGVAVSPLTTPSDSHFLIGAAHHIKRQQRIRGSIDEVRVWNVPLSGDQIRYIMNQEIEENGSLNADGKVLPSATTKNEIVSIPWSNLIAYYPMSNAVFGSIKDESNSGNDASMMNYDNIETQTAPLPYKSTQDGDWDTSTTWLNGDVQYLPGIVSYLYKDSLDIDKKTIDYNIVQIDHDITIDNSLLDVDGDLYIPAYKNRNRTVLAVMINATGDLELEGNNTTQANALTVSHYLEIDGVLDLEGESQLIQTDQSDLAVSSSGYLERDQQGTENAYTYNYWSSPVSLINTTENNKAFTVADILLGGSNRLSPNAITYGDSYAFADGSLDDPINISTYWIWKFVNLGNAYSNWQHVREVGTLNVTEGYTMKGTSGASAISDEQNYVFRGKPNNGDLTHTTFPGTFDGNGEPFITLTGNPYASALDADAFIDDNIDAGGTDAITGTLYFWEHWSDNTHYLSAYQGGYALYTKSGSAAATSHPDINQGGSGIKPAPGQFIPVAQGFFVTQQHDLDGSSNPINPSSGSVVFKNSQRVFEIEDGNSESIFTRQEATKENLETPLKSNPLEPADIKKRIWLGFESPTGFHRQVLAAFLTGATEGIDRGYEGRMIDLLPNDAYFIQEHQPFSIVAFEKFDVEREIPISIIIDEDNDGGTQKIMIDDLDNIEDNVNIYIKDNSTNIYYDLRKEACEIQLASGTHEGRLSLVFRVQESLSVEDEEILKENLTVFMNNAASEIQIRNNGDAVVEKVILYNILGQTVNTWRDDNFKTEINLQVSKLTTGVYIVNIKTDKGKITKKVIIE